MDFIIALLVFSFNALLGSLYEPRFDYEDLNYFEYQDYVSNGWLDPNLYVVEKNSKSNSNQYLDGYELINERVLIPNVRIGYLPIDEVPVEDYKINYDK